jgi:CxxC-x17-CxxC domain-containing protein
MAARILHFGQELFNRFPLLRNSGYSVERYEAILEFRNALESRVEHDAVSTTELGSDLSPLVVLAARTYSSAPLILFQTQSVASFPADGASAGLQAATDADFDLIVPAIAPARTWIGDIAALIGRSREVRERSRQIRDRSVLLREELEAIKRKTRFEIERGKLERARNPFPDAGSALLVDKLLICSRCGVEFVFTAGEQIFFQKRHFLNDPKVCKKCRSERKGGVSSNRPEFTLTCAECGIVTTVPFKPTQGRPVLCRACFEKHRLTPSMGSR